MYFVAITRTAAEQVLMELKKLPYETAQPLTDHIIYCLQHYCWDDEQQSKPNPVGFQTNNEVNIEIENDTDDTL